VDSIMEQEFFVALKLQEGRLGLMRELADSLEQVQTAVVRSNLAEITGHTARQRELCEAMRQLKSEGLRFLPGAATAGESPTQKFRSRLPEGAAAPSLQRRWNAVAEELSEIEIRVGQLNRVYGALLRRARRTVDILCRVVASSAITYGPPKQEPALAQAEFGEVSHV
jgi:hypothetical protein